MNHRTLLLASVAYALGACESSRQLVATPAAAWPEGYFLKVALYVGKSGNTPAPSFLVIQAQASDSAPATDSLPFEMASASTVAILVGGIAVPLSAQATDTSPNTADLASASGIQMPVMVTNPPSVAALLPRNDGTQDLHFLVEQRYVRTIPAKVYFR